MEACSEWLIPRQRLLASAETISGQCSDTEGKSNCCRGHFGQNRAAKDDKMPVGEGTKQHLLLLNQLRF